MAVKDSINKTLQCYKQYFLTKFSDDGTHENCDPVVKNILSNFNDTSNDPNDTTPNLLKSLTVRDSDKQALEELSRVLNNYLAGLVIETESKINNKDKLADQKDNVDKIKNILAVFPGGVNSAGMNQVQFACIGGSAERVEEAILVLKDSSPEVKSMQSAIDIFSMQIASKVEEGSQIHIKPCARGALMLDTSEVAKKDTHYASPQKDITLRRILEFCHNLADQVKKEINEPIENLNKIIIKYEALKEEEPISFSKINEFTKQAKLLGFNITIDDILAEDEHGKKYESNIDDGSVEKKSHLIDSDVLKDKYSTTIPSEKFQQELSKIQKPEFDYLKHLLDPKKLFKDSSELRDETSNRLDVKKIKNLVNLFPAKGDSQLDEESKNAQKSKMLAGLVTLRNILDDYKKSDNSYFYFLKFDKKFKEKTGESFEDFFYENINGKKEVKAEFNHAKPILDTIASRINYNEISFRTEGERLISLIYSLVSHEENQDGIKKLFTDNSDILELKNASGENLAKILYQFSAEVLLSALEIENRETKLKLFEQITEKDLPHESLLETITQRNEKELLLKILERYQGSHEKEGDEDGKGALGEMILQQNLLHFISINNQVDLLKAIIPMLNSADLNREINGVNPPLHFACQNGYLEIVKAFIDSERVNLDLADKDGFTPLYAACANGHIDIAQALIDAGANLNQASNDGFTPLFVACEKGHIDIVKILEKKISEVSENEAKKRARDDENDREKSPNKRSKVPDGFVTKRKERDDDNEPVATKLGDQKRPKKNNGPDGGVGI